MELDELSRAWQGMAARLDRQQLVLDGLVRHAARARLRSRLRLLATGQKLQLGVGLALLLWAGGYWSARLDQPLLAGSGILLHAWGIALLAAGIAQLLRLARIDEDQPVLALQGELLALRRLRFACERVLLPLGLLMWWPALVVALDLMGLAAWFARGWLAGNAVAAVVLAAGVAVAMHVRRDVFERDAAGRSLREAEAELAGLLEPPARP